MDNTQQPQDDLTPIEFTQDDVNGILADPKVGKALEAIDLGEADPPRNTGAPVSSFWGLLRNGPNGAQIEGASVVARGVLGAVNEASDTLVGAAAGISRATGAYKIGRSPEEEAAFLKAWEGDVEEANHFRIPEQAIDRVLGTRRTGFAGIVESTTQFAVGMAASSKVLKAVPAVAGLAKGGKVAKVAHGALQGAVVDLAFMDAHVGRLSNAIEQGPSWMRNPVSRFLAAKDDDGMLEAKAKAALEGVLLGATIDATILGVKAVRAWRAGNTELATDLATQAAKAAETPRPGDVATVREMPEGGFAVASTFDEDLVGSPVFPTRAEAENIAATANYVNRETTHAPLVVDAASVKGFQASLTRYAETSDPREAADLLDEYGVNFGYIHEPAEFVNTVKALVDNVAEPSLVGRGIPETWEETRRLAADLWPELDAQSPDAVEKMLQRAGEVFGTTDNLPANLRGMRLGLQAITNRARTLAYAADVNPENGLAHAALADALDSMARIHAFVTGTSSTVARTLRSLADPLEGAAKDAAPGASSRNAGAVSEESLKNLSKAELRALARAVFMADGDAAEVLAVLRGTKATRKAAAAAAEKATPARAQQVRDFGIAWRMEAMLSGPKTHITNAVSNAATMLMRPAEYWWAGVRTGNRELRQMSADMYQPIGMFMDALESIKAAGKTLKTGMNVLDPSDPHAIGTLPDLTGFFKKDPRQRALTAVSTLFRSPSRLLMSSDEFFKQMNYRMNVRAQVLRQAREQGVTDVKELATRLTDTSKFVYDADGGALNPWALQYARVGTFTNELGEDTVGAGIQNFVQKHPTMRLIMPFVRTPINIFRYTWERTPVLNRLSAVVKEDLASGDPERIALAHAKAEMGAVVWTAGAFLAYNKIITGNGPSDPALRDELKAAGWQPYSIKVGSRYVSTRRGDPLLTAFGIMADLVEMSGEMDEQGVAEGVAATMAAVASTVTSKTFMQGLSDFFEAVSTDQPHAMMNLLSNTTGSFIPNALRQMDPNGVIMETRGFLDEMRSRVPGFSDNLEPKRNLFGEKMLRPPGYFNAALNPFATTRPVVQGDENVLNELVKLGKGMPMPAETLDGGSINLTDRDLFDDGPNKGQSPYDRWLELMGSEYQQDDGTMSSLKAKLAGIVKDPEFKRQSDEVKLSITAGIVTGFKEAAYVRMLGEYKTLQKALGQAAEIRGAEMSGGDEAVRTVVQKYERLFVRVKKRPNAAM